jgi:hypothetical protein
LSLGLVLTYSYKLKESRYVSGSRAVHLPSVGWYIPGAAVAGQRTRRAAKGMDSQKVRFIGPVLSARAPDKKASNAETAKIAENYSRVFDK